jgi:hypothetical protein
MRRWAELMGETSRGSIDPEKGQGKRHKGKETPEQAKMVINEVW